MSGSNGHANSQVSVTYPRTAEMSAHERSEQADTMRRKLTELAAAHNRLVGLVDELGAGRAADLQSDIEWSRRMIALQDRHQAFVSRSFMARLRWLVTGR